MPRIRNYTSSVPVESSIDQIERRLVNFGATHISKQYDGGEIQSIVFTIIEPRSGMPLTIQMPAEVGKVNGKLSQGKKRLSEAQGRKILQQARRTAWKLMHDWLDCNLSMIAMEQAEPAQVFLPYVVMGKSTFYEHIAENSFKALTDQR